MLIFYLTFLPHNHVFFINFLFFFKLLDSISGNYEEDFEVYQSFLQTKLEEDDSDENDESDKSRSQV